MRLIRASGETITPSDDGRIIEKSLGDGLLNSVTFTVSSGQINMPAFKGILSGRDFSFDAQTVSPTLPTSGTSATGQIIVRIDLSSETPLSLITVLNPYTLTHDDLNNGGVVCEMSIATYTASLSGVSAVSMNYKLIVQALAGYSGDEFGDGVILSANGNTIVSGGEAGKNLVAANVNGAANGTTEDVHVAADNVLYFYSNCQTIANRKEMKLSTAGVLSVPGSINSPGNVNASGNITASKIYSDGAEVYPITYADVTVNLHTATWTQGTGIYFTTKAVTGWKWIFGLTICNDWGGFPALVIPYIAGTNLLGFMSTVNSFPSTNAQIEVRIMGVLA